MSICNKYFFTKSGNITKVFKDNYKLLRDYEFNCLISDNRKFISNLIFPNFIGRDFNEIIDYICYFINNKDNLYYQIQGNINKDNMKYKEIYLLKKKNYNYYHFYMSILKEKGINITGIIKKNFGDLIENDNIKVIKNKFINNNLNYCINSLRHLIYDNIYKEYKNTIFKNKEVKNYKELYYLIENCKKFKNKIKKIDKIAKILKKNIDTEIKSNLKILREKKIDLFNKESVYFKKIPNNISFYLQYLPEYFDKSYVKKELIKKLKENKIKYKL